MAPPRQSHIVAANTRLQKFQGSFQSQQESRVMCLQQLTLVQCQVMLALDLPFLMLLLEFQPQYFLFPCHKSFLFTATLTIKLIVRLLLAHLYSFPWLPMSLSQAINAQSS
jgi:hypothetical protein